MKYNLVGIDGNAYSIMGYVTNAMRAEGFEKKDRDAYLKKAMSGDYNHLLGVSIQYIDMVNDKVEGK